MDSLFTVLKSYIPSVSRNPQEDYLTELFAWMLANIPDIGRQFCQFLLTKYRTVTGLPPRFTIADDATVGVESQVSVEGGRIDMMLKVDGNGFICEHKIMSGLGDQQIERYAHAFSFQAGTYYTVLITATTLQMTSPPADILLTWADVYDFLRDEQTKYQGEFGFLLSQVTRYLEQQGLGRIAPLTPENILGFLPGNEMLSKIQGLLSTLEKWDWMSACPGLMAINPKRYAPEFHKSRWGRTGIDFFLQRPDWQPGLFAGVLFDETDHAIKFTDRRLGPDLVVFLEYDYYPKRKDDASERAMRHRAAYLKHEHYQQLCTRLAQDAGAFKFQGVVTGNPWRVIVLQQPLIHVIHHANSEVKQLDNLFAACCQGINMITQDGLLAGIPRS